MLLKNCRSRLERKQQILSRFVMPGVSFIGYNGSTSTFIKHTAPKYTSTVIKMDRNLTIVTLDNLNATITFSLIHSELNL